MPEYFVSTTGNNNNPGTIEKPFKTIQKCAELAQAGDTCYIREGTYRETVTPANSGEPGRPITFTAYQNEKVTISGADIIEGEWQDHENGIYKITLDRKLDRGIGNNQIFVDGEMMIEARWPNIENPVGLKRENHVISSDGKLLELNPTENNYYQASAYYQSPELKQFPEGFWDEAYISFVPGYEWWGNVGTAIASTSERVEFEFQFPTDWLKYHQPSGDDPFYLWGIYGALDSEKEWFFDVAGTQGNPLTLYFQPPGGTLEGKIVEIKTRDELFEFKNISYIHLQKIQLFGGRISLDRNSHHNSIERVVIRYAADGKGLTAWVNPAIRLDGTANQVLNSTITDTASSAIAIRGDNHIVKNNIITNTGYTSAVSDGIQVFDYANIEVSYNTIFNTSSLGISSIGKKVKVTHNHLWNIGMQETDTAAINSWNAGDAEGTEFAYNLIHDVVAYGGSPTHYAGKGLRLDSGGTRVGNSNYRIHDNIVYNTTGDSIVIWGLTENYPNYGNAQNYIENNTVESIRLTDKEGHSLAGTVVTNNIANEYKYNPQTNDDKGAIVENNLFYLTKVPKNLQIGQILPIAPNIKPTLTEYFPFRELGTIQLPYRGSYFENKQNQQEIGARPFVAGAVIIEEDLFKLSAKITGRNPNQIKISGLPLWRKGSENFQIKLENGRIYSDCYNITDTQTGYSTVSCDINFQDVKNYQKISVSLDGETFQPISLVVEPETHIPIQPAKPSANFTMFSILGMTALVLGLVWTIKFKLL